MNFIFLIRVLAVVLSSHAFSVKKRMFPDDFLFGTTTSAYQIEGAWNEDGKGENIWDHITHKNPTLIKDISNGDVAADTYHNYKRDVEMIRELGLNAYRFSISWSRILPNGFPNQVNQAGINFYNNYINEMLKYNITPIVTLYHWDLPQRLEELGGFVNPLIADWFEDYARIAFKNFGDRVKFWITFNELKLVCEKGFYSSDTIVTKYVCAKNLVMAHARAYHLYNNEFKMSQGGQCGITLGVNLLVPASDSEEDKYAVEINRQAEYGIYSEPIFSAEGGFPKDLVKIVAMKSAELGYHRSQMPEFTDEERSLVRGSSDFFGVNHYTAFVVQAYGNDYYDSIFTIERNITWPKEWKNSASDWLHLVPDSLYKTLSYLRDKYNDPIFYITENGWSTPADADLIDEDRISYYRAALENVLDCLDDGIKLKGYLAWSLMDNFEWVHGYTERYGLYHVDFESPARTRTPRKSAFVYKEIIRSRVIDHSYEPDSMVMSIDEGH